ncbi:hypothetical protein EDC04DRAFT_2911072 [Pisolithus marmoratus]|nr:hypothetical protein EDC04DRAFT_2911072 [Pisolithus marmoratus]
MNQPSSACSTLLNDIPHPTILQSLSSQAIRMIVTPNTHQASPPEAVGGMQVDFYDLPYNDWMDIQVDDMLYDEQELDSQYSPSGPSVGNIEYFLGTSQCYPSGRMLMDHIFSNEHSKLHKDNLFYPFTSQQDWQIALWLLCSCLSMAAINSFLSLDLIKELLLSF